MSKIKALLLSVFVPVATLLLTLLINAYPQLGVLVILIGFGISIYISLTKTK
jgi:hypothetical protein